MTTKRMAHLTDAHLGQRLTMGGIAGDKMRYADAPEEHEDQLRLVLDDISRRDISHIIFGGDIGTQDSVGAFFALLSEYDFAASIVLGNHDAYSTVRRYCDIDTGPLEEKMCSSRYDGPLKYVFLDSSDNWIGERQLAWLASELEKASKAAIFLHHPILGIDTPVQRSGVALRDRDQIKALLASFDCEVTVFCGHYHMIDEAHDANIRQFVTPAVSYQIVKQSDSIRVDPRTFGYRILEIDDAEIRTEIVLLARA